MSDQFALPPPHRRNQPETRVPIGSPGSTRAFANLLAFQTTMRLMQSAGERTGMP